MCVNDIIVQGAEPLFFLDYFATGRLKPQEHADIVKGIAEGCKQAGCALIGGETAEMPSFYAEDEYDLAGFAVGVVEKKKIIDGSEDQARATRSSASPLRGSTATAIHSCARPCSKRPATAWTTPCPNWANRPLGEVLLTPTRIYARPSWRCMKDFDIRGMAHITGGGITENTPRMLPKGTQALIRKGTWDIHPIFTLVKKKAQVDDDEMYRDFNMGIGMVLAVPAKQADAVIKKANKLGEKAYLIGEIVKGKPGVKYERRVRVQGAGVRSETGSGVQSLSNPAL